MTGDLVRRDKPRQWASGSVTLPTERDPLEEQILQAYRIPPEMVGKPLRYAGAIVTEYRKDADWWLRQSPPMYTYDLQSGGALLWTPRNTVVYLYPSDRELRGWPPDFPVVGLVRAPRLNRDTGRWEGGSSDRYHDFLAYQRLHFPQGYREETLP